MHFILLINLPCVSYFSEKLQGPRQKLSLAPLRLDPDIKPDTQEQAGRAEPPDLPRYTLILTIVVPREPSGKDPRGSLFLPVQRSLVIGAKTQNQNLLCGSSSLLSISDGWGSAHCLPHLEATIPLYPRGPGWRVC